MTTVLEARGLQKSYAGREPVHALRGVDIALSSGELVAVMGASGCGKSTLLHMLAGLDRPSVGEIYLHGRRVDGLSEGKWAKLRRREIGFVFQFFNLVTNLSVADNVELPALLAGLDAGEARLRRTALLTQLGIDDRHSAIPAELSGGQQQRVALARALVNRPAILLADEPTGNLDTAATREVLALLKEQHAEGQTILLVTHDARVASIADRVVVMRDGKVDNEMTLRGRAGATELLSAMWQAEA